MTSISPSVIKSFSPPWTLGGKAGRIISLHTTPAICRFRQNTWSQPIRHLRTKTDFVERTHGIITGPPGSGKGTVSERLVRDFKLAHISSGDLLRHHIMNKTELGLKIQPIVSSGGLVGIDLLAPMINQAVQGTRDNPHGFLLDGYPRTVEQAKLLDSGDIWGQPNVVIYLNVPFETIIDRIKARWVHVPSGRVYNLQFNPPKVAGKDDETGEPLIQREDDKPESVLKRLEQYQKSTDPVLKHYRDRNLLYEFKGTETNVIYPEIQKFMEKKDWWKKWKN